MYPKIDGFFAVFVLLTVLFLTDGAYRFDCEPNFCDREENACPKLDCQNGRLVKHATRCGCCDICMKSLKEGQKCPTALYGIKGTLEECGPGLVCDRTSKTCIPASTKCIENQQQFDRYQGTKSPLQERPECDDFGYFKPVACIPGILCYCVDKDGERIFGTDLSSNNETMKCDCSRDIKNFPRQVADGDFPRCLPNGNYDPLQCSDNMCFCMESLSPKEDVISVNASIKKLSCYDSLEHKNRLESKCWRERAKQHLLLHNESFSEVIGLDLIRCDLDGSYYPVQCKRNKCYCVNKDGEAYDGYRIDRNLDGSRQMKCDCLRDRDFLRMMNKRGKFVECDNLGNYKKIELN